MSKIFYISFRTFVANHFGDSEQAPVQNRIDIAIAFSYFNGRGDLLHSGLCSGNLRRHSGMVPPDHRGHYFRGVSSTLFNHARPQANITTDVCYSAVAHTLSATAKALS